MSATLNKDMRCYLATTGISEVWDLNSKLLLLGPWCVTSKQNKELTNGRNYTLIPSPWQPVAKIKEAADYCHEIYEELLPEVSENLNSLHSVSYPVNYWRVLIGPWLIHYIGVLYERYIRIKNALSLYPRLYTHTPDGDWHLATYDTAEFMESLGRDDYNFKLFGAVCSYLKVPSEAIHIRLKEEPLFNRMQDKKSRLKKFWQGATNRALFASMFLFPPGPVVLAHMHRLRHIDYLKLSLKVGTRLCYDFRLKDKIDLHYSSQKRQSLVFKDKGDIFKNLVVQTLRISIPKCYIEGYRHIKESTPSVRPNVKVVGSAVGWDSQEVFKFFAAEAVSKGASPVYFQHGAGYGNYLANPAESLSYEKDRLYVWGWESQDRGAGKLKNLPSAHLSMIRDSYSYSKGAKSIFVSAGLPRYQYRFFSVPFSEKFVQYLQDQINLLDELPVEIRRNLTYRPYVHNYHWNEKENLSKRYPEIELLSGLSVIEYMQKAKLVIIDHPGTAFIEALAINVPSVFFWDHNAYLMRPEAEGYFQTLRDSGILYSKSAEAAKKIIDVSGDPLSWWRSKEVQDARNIFLGQFGYSRKDWMGCWARELKVMQ